MCRWKQAIARHLKLQTHIFKTSCTFVFILKIHLTGHKPYFPVTIFHFPFIWNYLMNVNAVFFIEHPRHSLVFFIWSSLLRLADKPLSIELSIGTFGNSLEVSSDWRHLWHDILPKKTRGIGNRQTIPFLGATLILSPKSFYNNLAVSYLKQFRDLNQMIFNVISLVWTMIMVRNNSNFSQLQMISSVNDNLLSIK